MNSTVAPTNPNHDGAPEGSEVDRLLRGFFRAEMPDPWPSFEAPSPPRNILPFRPALTHRPTALRSRLALAASVAVLVGGAWLLGSRLTDPKSKPSGPGYIGGDAKSLKPGDDLPKNYTVPPVPVIEVKPDGARELKFFIEEAPVPPQ